MGRLTDKEKEKVLKFLKTNLNTNPLVEAIIEKESNQ